MAASVVVVGGGVFGLTAACELKKRGLDVELIEASTIPAVNAASTDISKIVRMDYGKVVFDLCTPFSMTG